jgi:hypothetical protein
MAKIPKIILPEILQEISGRSENERQPDYQAPRLFRASYTRNAGHTIDLRTPSTPIQNVAAVEM